MEFSKPQSNSKRLAREARLAEELERKIALKASRNRSRSRSPGSDYGHNTRDEYYRERSHDLDREFDRDHYNGIAREYNDRRYPDHDRDIDRYDRYKPRDHPRDRHNHEGERDYHRDRYERDDYIRPDNTTYKHTLSEKRTAECEILAIGKLDKGYLEYVEDGFKSAGINAHIQPLGPSAPVKSVIQRMAYDGVIGVVILDQSLQANNLIDIQVFEQSSTGTVHFEEFLAVSVKEGTELLNHKKYRKAPPISHPPPPPPELVTRSAGHNSYYNQAMHNSTVNTCDTVKQPIASHYSLEQEKTARLLGTLQNLDPSMLQQIVSAIQLQQRLQQEYQLSLGSQGYPPQTYPSACQSVQSSQRDPPSSSAPGQDVRSIMDQLAMLQQDKTR